MDGDGGRTKFYIETYGCTSNHGNSREVEEGLIDLGHAPSSRAEADFIIVNTCAVTEKTERKIRRRLSEIQGGRLVVAGCLPSALPGSIDEIQCSKVMGILRRSMALEISDLFGGGGIRAPALEGRRVQGDLCGIVNIAEGCTGRCSYCIVRKARGRLSSRPPEEIVDEVRRQVSGGVVEIQIAAQDTAAYGRDIGSSLPELLARITGIPGEFMVRVGMMKPDTLMPILDEMIEAYGDPKVYKFLHLPVQSGSDRVLDAMGRGYTSEEFLEAVGMFREAFDEITLTTDVIAGFPGETEGEFDETLCLMEAAGPDKVNVTKYSSRPGTPSSLLYDMPDRIKKERSRLATRLWIDIACKRKRRYLGEELDILMTERGRAGSTKARASNYLGVVVKGEHALGQRLRTRITGANPFYVTAEALGSSGDESHHPSDWTGTQETDLRDLASRRGIAIQ